MFLKYLYENSFGLDEFIGISLWFLRLTLGFSTLDHRHSIEKTRLERVPSLVNGDHFNYVINLLMTEAAKVLQDPKWHT